jgi:hypothetical protein
MRSLTVEPEKYNGKSSVESYLKKFERVAEWNGWSDREKVMMLIMKLRGPAESIMESLPGQKHNDYQSVCEHLTNKFGKKQDVMSMQAMFWGRSRCVNESVEDYAHELSRIGCEAYDGLFGEDKNHEFEALLVSKFVDGIEHYELGRHVYLQQPTTLDEAVTIAQQFLAYEQVTSCSSPYECSEPDVNSVQADSIYVQAISDLERKVDTLMLEIRDIKQELKERKYPGAEMQSIKQLVHVCTMTTDELNYPLEDDATDRSTLYCDEDCQSGRPAGRKRKRVRRRKRRKINKSAIHENDPGDDPSGLDDTVMSHSDLYEQCPTDPPGDMECRTKTWDLDEEDCCSLNADATLDTEVLVGDLCQMKNVDAAPMPCGPMPCHVDNEYCNIDNHESFDDDEGLSSWKPVDEKVEEKSATRELDKSEADPESMDVSLHGYVEPLQDRDDGMTVFSCGWKNPILVPWNGRPPDDYHSEIDGFTCNN